MRVLFLTPWYPSAEYAMSGLFVQKHAEAVRAQGDEVRVIFSQTWRDTWRQWRSMKREGWMPDIVQLNVLQKQGLLALWLNQKYGIPYIIVEHWSGYLPENGQFMQFSSLKRKLFRRIAAQASMVLTVSQRLADCMRACGIEAKQWGTMHNVVDDFFYQAHQTPKAEGPKTLLHVSCFDEQAKNVKALLRAAKMLSDKRQDWRLMLVGTGVDYQHVRDYAKSLDIPQGLLEWTGELTPKEVAKAMQQADALVLSSRYETYGVVLAEAAAAGLPILSTPVGIAEETGALIVSQEIAQHKPGKFAEFIETILWNTDYRTKHTAPSAAACFTAEIIGQKLHSIYDSCLHRDI